MTRIISVDGNIGSGKSTFIEKLKKYFKSINLNNNLKISFLQEPVDIWNTITDNEGTTVIEHFYSNQEKYAFSFQMMAYISRLITIKNELQKDYDIIFTERCILTDRNVFAKMLYDDGKINEIEFKIYNTWFHEFISDFPEIEYIYLKTDPEIAFNRIIKRGRTGENIPLEYLTKCNDYHESWLHQYPSKCVLDCNIDIEENPQILTQWIEKINKYIEQYTITFDGESRSNPGYSVASFIIWNNNNNNIKLYEGTEFVSYNNTKEFSTYYALLSVLNKCIDLNIENIIIKSDSESLIYQFTNKFQDNNLNIYSLYNQIIHKLKHFSNYKFVHINNNENKEANFLANKMISDYYITKHRNLYNLNSHN